MQNFASLEALSQFDFRQMRALDNRRATDAALDEFHDLFYAFFSQFQSDQAINLDILQTYVMHMTTITQKINEAEFAFYLAKYQVEEPNFPEETILNMATLNELDSYKRIPVRMQYWAAGNFFGDTIRFPEKHRQTARALSDWNRLAESQGINPVMTL